MNSNERVAWYSSGETGSKLVKEPALSRLPFGDYNLFAVRVTGSIDDEVKTRRQVAVEFFTLNPSLAEMYMDKHLQLQSDIDEDNRSEAFADFADDFLTDGNGYAPSSTYEACCNAFNLEWPDRDSAYAAAKQAYEFIHGVK